MSASYSVQLLLKGLFILFLSSLVSSQDACMRLNAADLGRTDMLEASGLISNILRPAGEATNPAVRVIEINIVCEAQHMMKDRYRYTSVVVSFNCESTDIRLHPECANSAVVNTEQFDLGCSGGQWTADILSVNNEARTMDPNATLTTELDTGCRFCINPDHPSVGSIPGPVDNVTHCLGELTMIFNLWC